MYKKISLIVLLSIIFFFSGCAELQNILKDAIKKPTVSFEKVDFKDVSLFDTTMLFDFKVTNPNPVGIRIKNIAYNLKMYGRDFAQGVLDRGIDMSANSSNIVQLPVKVKYLDLFKTAGDYLKNDRVNYDISGAIGVGAFEIPYQKAGSFIKPRLPDISLKRAKVNKLDLTGAKMLFVMGVKNPNKFPIKIKNLNYGIKLSGVEFTSGRLNRSTNISSGGSSEVRLPVNVQFLQLGQSLMKVLGGSSSNYELNGEMNFDVPGFGVRSFPFKKTGELPFIK